MSSLKGLLEEPKTHFFIFQKDTQLCISTDLSISAEINSLESFALSPIGSIKSSAEEMHKIKRCRPKRTTPADNPIAGPSAANSSIESGPLTKIKNSTPKHNHSKWVHSQQGRGSSKSKTRLEVPSVGKMRHSRQNGPPRKAFIQTIDKEPLEVHSRVFQRKRGYRPGERALKEIRKYQRTTNLLLPRRSFANVVREVCNELGSATPLRWTATALECLQEASEAFVTHLLQDSYLVTAHSKRLTLMKKDLELARRLRGRE